MYLFGASGHAKVIADILEQMGEKVEGIIDDNKQLKINGKTDINQLIIPIN